MSSEDEDRTVEGIQPITSILKPSQMVKMARGELQNWLCPIINTSLRSEHVPAQLKEAIIRPLLWKPNLYPAHLTNFRPCF